MGTPPLLPFVPSIEYCIKYLFLTIYRLKSDDFRQFSRFLAPPFQIGSDTRKGQIFGVLTTKEFRKKRKKEKGGKKGKEGEKEEKQKRVYKHDTHELESRRDAVISSKMWQGRQKSLISA
jgi:hypothetical protein